MTMTRAVRVAAVAVAFVLTPVTVMAQGSVCSEQKIRDAINNHTVKSADDVFFWSGAYDKPLIGKVEIQEALKKLEANTPRKNQVEKINPQRIVVSRSGDMAYEYGTGELSFDDVKSGKHIEFQNAYLTVWKSVDGQCEIAAKMARPIESTRKTE
jgi:ketosteroid isomerase-like protein